MKYTAVIIGSGAAGYAAANRLLDFGISDIALITESKNFGTSRNTGSDKQTYYKADLSVSRQGILDMAEAIYGGGAIDGDMAIVESCNSVRCFYTLVDLGVDFPEGDYGEFIGYQTDHDSSERATSIGPLTSKAMTEALERAALDKGLNLIDKRLAIKVVVRDGAVKGVITWNKDSLDCEYIEAENVVLAVGGSACVYDNVVYPASQHGMMSLALDAGCSLTNIAEWQYGIASTKFRWNLSGSYQQVIPRYISVDNDGIEREFLGDYLEDECKNIFLKGYEWPFDTRKIHGSSQVDMAVLEEIKKGRHVYMDFMHNPASLVLDEVEVAYNYLSRADAIADTPYERLMRLNPKAIELYRAHNIDLETEYLEIAVCAQHCNGGVRIDSHYESDVKGLFAIGEVSGNFGVYRPGGTALNSTQVGALRVASYIRDHRNVTPSVDATDEIEALRACAERHIGDSDNVVSVLHDISRKMTAYCGIVRDVDSLHAVRDEIAKYLDGSLKISIKSADRVGELFRLYDMLKTDIVLIDTIIGIADTLKSHGGALVKCDGDIMEHSDVAMDKIVSSNYDGVSMRERKPIEVKTYSFEKELNKKN